MNNRELYAALSRGTKRLRYCTLAPKSSSGNIIWRNREYYIGFEELGVDDLIVRAPGDARLGYRTIVVRRAIESQSSGGDRSVDPELLSWLSLFIGEDVFSLRSSLGLSNPDLRGEFLLRTDVLQDFLFCAETWCDKNICDKWQKACLDSTFGYFCMAISLGLNATPVTETIFAFCIETLANVANFSTERHLKIAAKSGPQNLFNSVRNQAIRRNLLDDLNLLKSVRDKVGAHYALHQTRERIKITDALREWYMRKGHTKEFAELSFLPERVLDDLQRSAHEMYLTGLTLCRACFFALIGQLKQLPFARRDARPDRPRQHH
jgi:hypothetical protein